MRHLSILAAACGLLCLVLPGLAHPQVGRLPFDDLHHQVWTTREGIPHNTINAIAQTPDGYLWFATWEGIARFNGHRFRLFERGPETGLPDAGVLSLSVDEGGRLVAAGARGGLSLTDGHSWQPLATAPTMITHAVIDSHRQLWIATQGAGVIRRQLDESGRMVAQESFLSSASAHQVLTDDRGAWAATSRGLLRIPHVGEARLVSGTDLPSAPVLSLLADDDGRLFVGTEQGLYVRDGLEQPFRSVHARLDDLAVSALLEDRGGALWIGTINSGLYRLNGGGVRHLGTQDGLPNNRVVSLYQDFEHSLWVGTNGGLFRLRSAPFVTTTRDQGLVGNYVRAVMPHADGSLWVGTSEGVSRIDGEQARTVGDGDDPIALSTLSLAQMPGGDVLIGTHSDGVLHWRDGQVVARHDRASGLPSNDIRYILVDREQRIWIATASGLARVDQEGTTVFLPRDGLPGDFVIAVEEDSRGQIWVGTGFGLARYAGGHFEPISLYHLDEAMYVYGIHEDRTRYRLWLATDRGLVRYDPISGDAELVGRSAGMPVDKLFHVVDDRHGAFWLTSNRGIIRVLQEQAVAVADGEREKIDFELYTEGDGLLSAQANGGAGPPAAWHEGRVWVATAVGLASVDPDHLTRYEDTVLPVSIEHFAADGNEQRIDGPVKLPAGTGRVTIQYAGLGFIMPQRIRYRTKLEGFDDEWVDRRGQNVAEYTNLGPGDYVFRVSAAYPYGDWNGSETSLRFSIAPLPWQRAWFWVVVILALSGLIGLATQWRMRRLERRARELSAQVDEKTRELKQQAENFERQARIDQLTGLANRRAFDEWLAEEFRRSRSEDRPLSLVIMDLDHFKRVNDEYSHLIGDEVMRVVADVLRKHVRAGDQAARWGGEEFTLTFHDIDGEQAAGISERIRRSIETTDFGRLAPDLTITASFGVSDNRQAQNYEDLLRQADQALFRAKDEGRNRVVVHVSETDS
ncbi:ligand-binding sensor domain-containing diguanylate cyclase [Wenzhouxiangella sediminis]|uniref:diguanylate cyclase n=1 Tax=Wenzhouxiangella sediminis TaxID=1792836 RepID=A0A3E1KBZ0_9GAMM|nr:ligand-binding sensor domain-containing diguanylate cyclase [Wenzhouxiangella sediminis]RFF32224.1 GGDEF domain-containing protein [Wenzhouxiangella sediminis]